MPACDGDINQFNAAMSPAEVHVAELQRGSLISGLTIQSHDGSWWTFDVPKANQRAAALLVEQLGGVVR